MPIRTQLTERLGLTHPIIQAPLAGGGDTPALVSAVCDAGALGFIGAAYLSPSQIVESSREVRARTSRPFGINLFAPLPAQEKPRDPAPAMARVSPFFAELGLPAPGPPVLGGYSFEEQLSASLASGASVFSFTFGLLPPDAVLAIKAQKMFLMGTATTVEEAARLEKSGVDAIVTQGSEAGGHRGTFAASFEAGQIGTMALVPQVADHVSLAVIASGGIMDGRGIAAALALGASAVQMGTAFLTCDESGVPEAYKQAILTAREQQTRVTRAFSGRPARGIINRFMTAVDGAGSDEAILPFPLQNALTRPLRNAAAKQNLPDYLSLWAGQGLGLSRRQSAASLVHRLAGEAEAVILGLRGLAT